MKLWGAVLIVSSALLSGAVGGWVAARSLETPALRLARKAIRAEKTLERCVAEVRRKASAFRADDAKKEADLTLAQIVNSVVGEGRLQEECRAEKDEYDAIELAISLTAAERP
jgi:hypothetical protein